jgi:T-lymphoma invasion and metastasis-inducing protein 1
MTASIGIQQNHIGLQIGQDDSDDKQSHHREETSKSEGTQAGGSLGHQKSKTSTGTGTRSKDYNENIMHEHQQMTSNKRSKSKSTEDMHVDSGTLKKMIRPIHGNESPVTSPEMGRRRYNYYNASTNTGPHGGHQHIIHNSHLLNNNSISRQSSQSSRFSGSR